MNPEVLKLLLAQFLTAFADNAVLFTAITMVLAQNTEAGWYIPALQGSFLVAFVLLAPWVGRFADSRSKPDVLWKANIIKAGGALLMMVGAQPLLAYAVIGIGAAIYSPAKYGILPELVSGQQLVRANGWIESSTILAILSGTLAGALVSEHSILLALALVFSCFVLSAGIARWMSPLPVKGGMHGPALTTFIAMNRTLLATPKARFSTLAVSLFWSSAAVLRVLIVAWAPLVLFIHETSEIAKLTLFVALGIAVGAVVVPRLIPLAQLRRARMAGYAMGAMIILLSQCDDLLSTRVILFAIGLCSGIFVVPINAALQDIGHRSVGSGGAVAVQNFFENLAMLVATGLYTLSVKFESNPIWTVFFLGVIVMLTTVIVSWHLPKDETVNP